MKFRKHPAHSHWLGNLVKNLMPFMYVIFLIGLLLFLGFVFNWQNNALWVGEQGVLEIFSAVGYIGCAIWMIVKGGKKFIRHYHYWLVLMIFFALRELDFDKQFTTHGILSMKLYSRGDVLILEKLIGLLVVVALGYCIFRVIKAHTTAFLRGLKIPDTLSIGVALTMGVLVLSKTLDGLARKLADVNIAISASISSYVEMTEETLELLIPLLILSTLHVYFATRECVNREVLSATE